MYAFHQFHVLHLSEIKLSWRHHQPDGQKKQSVHILQYLQVKNSVHGGFLPLGLEGCTPPRKTPLWANTPGQTTPPPQADTPLGRQPTLADIPLGRHPQANTPQANTPGDSHCSRRYASHWNAFLWNLELHFSYILAAKIHHNSY